MEESEKSLERSNNILKNFIQADSLHRYMLYYIILY